MTPYKTSGWSDLSSSLIIVTGVVVSRDNVGCDVVHRAVTCMMSLPEDTAMFPFQNMHVTIGIVSDT